MSKEMRLALQKWKRRLQEGSEVNWMQKEEREIDK